MSSDSCGNLYDMCLFDLIVTLKKQKVGLSVQLQRMDGISTKFGIMKCSYRKHSCRHLVYP